MPTSPEKSPLNESEEEFEAPIKEEDQEDFEPIEIKEDKVSIMGVELERKEEPGPRTPPKEKFDEFIPDKFSLEMLQKIAKGIKMDDPTLLEGDAAIGKSYTIEFLAQLTNNELYRMSLNGQTDTTDLIGKWVPNSEEWRDEVEKILENPELCETDEAREIIKTAKAGEEDSVEDPENLTELYGLTKKQMQSIAKLEGIPVKDSEWVWQDGELPSQIKNDAWTVLDEMNTCEPQILVRLNSVLEDEGELVLHENSEEVVEGSSPILATTNPPGREFKGRAPLSREYISRWNYHNIGDLPEEVAIKREKGRLGLEIELEEDIEEGLEVDPIPVSDDLELSDVFEDVWVEDFTEKYVGAFYKLREKLDNGELARDQSQSFTFDQRDFHRFSNYIETFREPGNMQQVIEDAVDYCILDKFQDSEERQKAKDIVLGLIDVDEPNQTTLETEESQEKMLNNLEAEAISTGIPEEYREFLK